MFGRQLIVLDYDETYTAKPELWDLFIKLAQSFECQIVCCTLRHKDYDNSDLEADLKGKGVSIVYAADYKSKIKAMNDHGYDTQDAIWIDDAPEFIGKPIPSEEYTKYYGTS